MQKREKMSKPIQISYSAASTYKSCPQKHALSRIYKPKSDPSAFPFGKCVEDSVTQLFLGVSLEEVHKKFQNDWKAFFDAGIQFSASDIDTGLFIKEDVEKIDGWLHELDLDFTLGYDEVLENIQKTMKDRQEVRVKDQIFHNRVAHLCCEIRGMYMLKSFAEKLLPKLQLVKVNNEYLAQKEITIENDVGDKITGFVDYVIKHEDYAEPIIADLKTAAYPYPRHALVSSEQLRTYVASLGQQLGTNRAGYIVLLKKIQTVQRCEKCRSAKKGKQSKCNCGGAFSIKDLDSEVQFVTIEYKTEELEDLLQDYEQVATAVKNNIVYKNPGNCQQWGRQCEFYEYCWEKKKLSEIETLQEKEKRP